MDDSFTLKNGADRDERSNYIYACRYSIEIYTLTADLFPGPIDEIISMAESVLLIIKAVRKVA